MAPSFVFRLSLLMLYICFSSVQLLMLLLLLLVTVLIDLTDESQSSCIFDSLRRDGQDVPSTKLTYPLPDQQTSKQRQRRSLGQDAQRSSLDELFAPIRVASFFFDMELEANEKEKLKFVINKSLTQIENIFSVIRVKGRLLLSRSGCFRSWTEGNNTGRCNSIKRNYNGEWCADEFQVPDDHLDGLYVWDDSHPDPIKTFFHEGHGLNGTDFILYSQSISSHRCNHGVGQSVIAYATYCQLDQNGRPIAAYINICPQTIRDNSKKLSITVLHELFHALGFSSDLFDRFKRCFLTADGSVTCQPRSHRPVQYVNGARRLVTERVAEMTSRHLNCHVNQTMTSSSFTFGAILQTEGGEVRSHWDAAFLQGSLMMPTIAQPHLMFLDAITLALFEDSGWYKVNYSSAQELRWGKGEGCDFGLTSNCQSEARSPFFCQPRQSSLSIGCHYLRKDKGRCGTNQFLHGCGIYDPQPEDSCLTSPRLHHLHHHPSPLQSTSDDDDDDDDGLSSFGESFGESSRCFLTNLTREVEEEGDNRTTTMTMMQPLEGRCLQRWCNATNHLFVKVGGNWTFCPAGTLLQISVAGLVSGTIECPMKEEDEDGILCSSSSTQPSPVTASSSSPSRPFTSHITTSSSSSTPSADKGDACNTLLWLEMLFDSLPVIDNCNNNNSNNYNNDSSKEEVEEGLEEKLKQRLLLMVVATLDNNNNNNNTWCNMSNVALVGSRNAVQFALTVSNHQFKDEDELVSFVMELLRREVDAGHISFSLFGSIYTAKVVRVLSVSNDASHSMSTTLWSSLSTVNQLPPSLSPVASSAFISAIAIGSVICFVVMIVVVVLFARCCLTRQRKNNNQSLSTEQSFQGSTV